jgi:DNA ligase-1
MPDYIVHKAIEADALSAKVLSAIPDDQEWVVSPKYDGCHAVICFDNGQHIQTYSRTGESVYSLNHVARDLLLHYPTLAAGRWAICGEAWNPNEPFNKISGAFRRQDPDAADLYFVPFDVVPWAYNDETTSGPPVLLNPPECGIGPQYASRIGVLYTAFRPAISKVIKPKYDLVRGRLSDVLASVRTQAQALKELGTYDGCILARADGRYTVGAGKGGEFIKVKPLVSHSVVVTGYEQAVGEKTGKNTVALTFLLDGKLQRVSTGLTQQQVDSICNSYSAWDGVTIEVEAMGTTANGYLREPRFTGIRTDA